MTVAETKEEPVSFIDDDAGDTVVDLNPSKPEPSKDDERWARAEQENRELRSRLDNIQSQSFGNNRESSNNKDEFDSQEEQLNEREKALGIAWEADKAAGRLKNSGVIEDYDKKARQVQSERAQIATNRALKNALPQILHAQQAQTFRTQYNDVYNNPRAASYAEGTYKQLLAMGETDGPQLVDKAMNQARVQFKMGGGSMKPTEHDKAQMSSVGGGGGRSSVDNTVRMGKAEKSMAMAMYGDAFNGDEKKAYQKWASGPGLRAKKAARQRQGV